MPHRQKCILQLGTVTPKMAPKRFVMLTSGELVQQYFYNVYHYKSNVTRKHLNKINKKFIFPNGKINTSVKSWDCPDTKENMS